MHMHAYAPPGGCTLNLYIRPQIWILPPSPPPPGRAKRHGSADARACANVNFDGKFTTSMLSADLNRLPA